MVPRYDAFDHIGYDATGAKLMRRKAGDRIDMTIGEKLNNINALEIIARQSRFSCYLFATFMSLVSL